MDTTENNRPSSEPSDKYAGFYPVIAPLIMSKGVGDGRNTACVMAQAATIDALRKGQTLDKPTDEMDCACPMMRRIAISLNDISWWDSDEDRTEHLRPLIPLLLDSRGSLAITKRRAAHWTNAVIHRLTPTRLEWIAANTKSEKLKADIATGLKAIEGIAPITDLESANSAKEALSKFYADAYADAYASASASAYADAYAYASASAYADAYAYASASAYADAYASASASAYAYAYASASASAYAYAYAYASASAYADADADADASASASAKKAKAQKLKYRAMAIEVFKEIAAMKEEV